MPFVLYKKESPGTWKAVGEVELSGKNGPLATFVRCRTGGSYENFGWQISEAELLSLLGIPDSENRALILEANPSNRTATPRVRKLSGFSGENFTTVLLCLDDGAGMKDGSHSYRLLHLDGGTVQQNWTWVSNGHQPSLAPEALEFLLQSVTQSPDLDSAQPASAQSLSLVPIVSSRNRSNDGDPLYSAFCRDLDELLGPEGQESGGNGKPPVDGQMCEGMEMLFQPSNQQAAIVPGNVSNALVVQETAPANDTASEDCKPDHKIHQAALQWAKTQ